MDVHSAFHIHQNPIFIAVRLTYLMPRFTYCLVPWTLDLQLIRLVIDCPCWTSLVYISRPVLVELGLKPDLVQSCIVLAVASESDPLIIYSSLGTQSKLRVQSYPQKLSDSPSKERSMLSATRLIADLPCHLIAIPLALSC